MRKFIILFISFIFTLTASAALVDWDLHDDDCSSITGSHYTYTDDSSVSATTFDGKSCFKEIVNTPRSNSGGYIGYDIAVGTDDYTVEVRLYVDKVLTEGANANSIYYILTGDTYHFISCWNKDGKLFVRNSSSIYIDTGATFAEDEWNTWRFEVHNNQTDVDVFKNGVLVAEDMDCADNKVYPSSVSLLMFYGEDIATTCYWDWWNVDTGVNIVPVDKGVRLYTGSENIKIGCQPLDNSTHQLRVRGNSNTTYGIPLVATDDYYASALRIYDGSNIKSIPKVVE